MILTRYICYFFVLTSFFFIFSLPAQYESQQDEPGLNPDHSEKLYDELLKDQGIEPPAPQPGTEPDDNYNPPADFDDEENENFNNDFDDDDEDQRPRDRIPRSINENRLR